MVKPSPDELHIEDDEGREEFKALISDLICAARGRSKRSLQGTLDDVWYFVFGEAFKGSLDI